MISGFGKFQVKNKGDRRGRNPATDEDMILSARKVVTFLHVFRFFNTPQKGRRTYAKERNEFIESDLSFRGPSKQPRSSDF